VFLLPCSNAAIEPIRGKIDFFHIKIKVAAVGKNDGCSEILEQNNFIDIFQTVWIKIPFRRLILSNKGGRIDNEGYTFQFLGWQNH
jgi:hypothetical protein